MTPMYAHTYLCLSKLVLSTSSWGTTYGQVWHPINCHFYYYARCCRKSSQKEEVNSMICLVFSMANSCSNCDILILTLFYQVIFLKNAKPFSDLALTAETGLRYSPCFSNELMGEAFVYSLPESSFRGDPTTWVDSSNFFGEKFSSLSSDWKH